jgi:dipeptidyl aminopeptidase/acylaminoacyl peptidase
MPAGTLTIPSESDRRPFPAVILIAGSGPQERDSRLPGLPGYQPFREIADALGRRGIAVLRFDERGVGTSTGDFSAATSEDLADDVRAALAFLRARSDIDGSRIGLAGHSEGGLIAPMVAAADPAVAAVVSLAGPSRTGREILDYQLRRRITADSALSAAERAAALDKIPAQLDALSARPWEAFFLGYDPLPAARTLQVPVLLLQGAADIQVTPEQAEELAAAVRTGGNPNVTVRVFPEINHLFVRDAAAEPTPYPQLPSLRVAPEVLEALASWLETNLE